MVWTLVIWIVSVLLILVLLAQDWWRPRLPTWRARTRARWQKGRVRRAAWGWYLGGYPTTAVRIYATWRRLSATAGLAVVRRPRDLVVAGTVMRGAHTMALRPLPARLGLVLPTRIGLSVDVALRPGQTPEQFMQKADAIRHAWRVYGVRVTSPARGVVRIMATARDPLSAPELATPRPVRFMLADLGRMGDGGRWFLDFRAMPHHLVTGATRSGKSNLLARLVAQLAPQPVALVGIDCKGGLELGLFRPRLSALARDRSEAAWVLACLVAEATERMEKCRAAEVRTVWDLSLEQQIPPIVVLVDEIAELFLSEGTKAAREEVADCSTYLLRLAQMGAALGIHLVISGQRVGSELGPRLTALRAQLAGRICHRVADAETAVMTLGDRMPDAVDAAQAIGPETPGIAVTATATSWAWVRSALTTEREARDRATDYAGMAPDLSHAFPSPPGSENG